MNMTVAITLGAGDDPLAKSAQQLADEFLTTAGGREGRVPHDRRRRPRQRPRLRHDHRRRPCRRNQRAADDAAAADADADDARVTTARQPKEVTRGDTDD